MDFWHRAKTFADEAAKRSQEISAEAAKRSQELTKGAARFSQELVAETAKKSKELAAETAKKSKELAAEASKRADEIRVEALKRADQIKSLTAGEIPISIPPLAAPEAEGQSLSELGRFGVTDELREFVKGITMDTFRDFPLEDIDEPEISDVPMVTNVRQDLNEWQAQHATLVLSIVKEISKYRYELCPRYMKERKFWRIYFVLVNNYVSLYEKQYMESRLKLTQSQKDRKVNESAASLSASKPGEEEIKLETRKPTQHEIGEKPNEFEAIVSTSKPGEEDRKLRSKTSTSDHDLDAFLLGDGSSDEGPDDVDDGLDDDFDKIEDKLA